jgi:hypothetical protein
MNPDIMIEKITTIESQQGMTEMYELHLSTELEQTGEPINIFYHLKNNNIF